MGVAKLMVDQPMSLLRFELRRTIRNPGVGIGLLLIIGFVIRPIVENGPEGVRAIGVAGVLLPLLAGWTWGADLERGWLVIPMLAGISPARVFMAKFWILAALVIAPTLLLSLFLRSSIKSVGLVIATVLYLLLFGFLAATILRSSQAGWIVLFAILFAIVLPVVQLWDVELEKPPLVFRILICLFVPEFALKHAMASHTFVVALLLCMSVVSVAINVLLLKRRSILANRS